MNVSTRGSRIAAEFDHKAPEYEDNRLSQWYQAQDLEVLDLAACGRDDLVLDIGCGTGWFLRTLAHRSPSVRGIGLDISGGMIRIAEQRARQSGSSGLRFICSDWEDGGPARVRSLLGDENLDRAICVSTLHYFQHPVDAFSSVCDLLKPGGTLYLVDRTRSGSALTVLWDLLHRSMIHDQVKFYSTADLRQILVDAGFVDIQLQKTIQRLYWKGKAYTSLALLTARRA